MKNHLDIVAFDADDTLWSNERLYRGTEAKYIRLLAGYGVAEVNPTMHEAEVANLRYYGYGIKGFILSLIESAVILTSGRISAADVQQIIDWGKEMQTAPVEMLPHVRETVAALSASYPLMLITKGDLFDQESKLERSGLGGYFSYIEIVSDKTQDSYATILTKYHIVAPRFLMVGNSMRSDILPVVALGAHAVYVPSELTWAHEAIAAPDASCAQHIEIADLGKLVGVIERIEQQV